MNALQRPAVFQCTRLVGLTDSDLCRLLQVFPNAVSCWTRGINPIPLQRHATLISFVTRLASNLFNLDVNEDGTVDDYDYRGGVYAARARALQDITDRLIMLAHEEIGEATPEIWQQAYDDSEAMLKRLPEAVRRPAA